MVVNIELPAGDDHCGMTMSVGPLVSSEYFQRVVATVLVPDAVRTLGQLGRPLVFELFWEPDQRVVGWRA
jgi:hypothetical protein